MPIETDNQQNKPPAKQIGGSFLLLLTFLLVLNLIVPSMLERTVQNPYSEFIQQVESDRVIEATVGNNRIEYAVKTDKGEQKFITIPVALDLDLPKILRAHHVKFSAASNEGSWIGTVLSWVLPPLIFVAIWSWFMSRGDMGSSVH
jgi:cell division protease FtsH